MKGMRILQSKLGRGSVETSRKTAMQCELERRNAKDGTELSARIWRPHGPSKAIVAVIHGYLEHGGRFDRIAERLIPQGFEVRVQDMRGHGLSQGLRGYLRSYEELVEDARAWLTELRNNHPGKPIFLLGNSLGGTIAVLVALNRELELSGMILTGAVIKVSKRTLPWLQPFAGIMGRIIPKVGLVPLPLDHITNVAEELDRLRNDPLTYQGALRARTGLEIIRSAKRAQGIAGQVFTPLLLMHGSEDLLADCQGVVDFFNRIDHCDKTLRVFAGAHHDIFSDAIKEDAYFELLQWLKGHVPESPQQVANSEASLSSIRKGG